MHGLRAALGWRNLFGGIADANMDLIWDLLDAIAARDAAMQEAPTTARLQAGIAERDATIAAQARELERHRHGETIESDFICPDSVALTQARVQLAEAQRENERLQAANGRLTLDLHGMQDGALLRDLRAQLVAVQVEHDAHNAAATQYERDIEALRAQLAERDAEIEQLTGELDRHRQFVAITREAQQRGGVLHSWFLRADGALASPGAVRPLGSGRC